MVDVASEAGQRIAPVLSLILEHTASEVTILLNPMPQISDMPIKRFYRAVLPSVSFTSDGNLETGPLAIFTNLPRSSLLTLGLETPSSWIVKSKESKHDLDNIHLESSKHGKVHAIFELGLWRFRAFMLISH